MVLQPSSVTDKMQPKSHQHVALTGFWELHCHRDHCGGLAPRGSASAAASPMARHCRRTCKSILQALKGN